MIAAIKALEDGNNVTVFEKNDRSGKKLLATGNGRCNFTNINMGAEYYYGESPKFVHSPLGNFGCYESIDFFKNLGIYPSVEDDGKVFPMSYQASSVLDVLRYRLNELGAVFKNNFPVSKIEKRLEEFLIKSEIYKEECFFDRVIIATGGKAMPESGSNGDGYSFAKSFGHTIIEDFPSLVQLKLDDDFLKSVDGVKFSGKAKLYDMSNKLIMEDSSDILYTSYGISGPAILQISRPAGQLLIKGEAPRLEIKILDMNEDDIYSILKERIEISPKKSAEFMLVGLINKKLIPMVLKKSEILDINIISSSISDKSLRNLSKNLCSLNYKVIGTKEYKFAQATAGGVSTKEINPKTMESKLQSGLYFAGEVIDIDGMCGGYNLQWAWSSGYLAGSLK